MSSSVNHCPNCGVCFCTGAQVMRAQDDRICCSHCISKVNTEITAFLKANPTMTLRDLKFQNRRT